MKKSRVLLLFLIVCAAGASTWFIASNDLIGRFFNEDDPDRSPTGVEVNFEEYVRARIEHMDLLRGFDTAQQDSRTNAIREMEQSERALERQRRGSDLPEVGSWTPLGPAPIPVGSTSNSGRTSAIAVHPTNPNIVYVGTAQGGLYRTLNGGTTWTPLMDSALTIAIGAVAISPSNPSTVFVGTGESTLCGSGCFIGVGLYRITNADTTPVLSDALNKNAANADVFTGRAISEVLVHPTDPNTVFVGTSTGVAGIGGTTAGATLPAIGVYRTTNAMSASPTFTKLSLPISDRSVTDLVMEPGNPNHIFAGVVGVSGTDGGVYATTNALDASPTFTQVLATTLTGTQSRVELAATQVSEITTVFAASGEGTGSVYKSVDGGPFTLAVDNNFCNPQCFYDIAIAVDPTDANKVYLAGSPTLPFGRSTNGGTSFANSSTGLHVDSQVITVAPSNPSIVYFGSDGGIWKTTNVNATPIAWTSLNNSTFSATQFVGLSLHPTDRNYSLGGTQDNGTEFLAPDGLEWIRSDGGDGGFSVIDQDSLDTTNVVAYHTYFNQTSPTNQIGFTRATDTVTPGDPNWVGFHGCTNNVSNNGIGCGDPVLFYAPMVGGPTVVESTGNTLYFGTNKLYRSVDQGNTMTSVGSAGLSARISAIAISAQDDNVRLVGTSSGAVLLQTAPGANTLTTVTGAIAAAARYVGRTAIDPTNANVAYVCLNGFGLTAGQHVWKTSNLLSGTPTWVVAGNGIPDTPVNAFAIDPLSPNTLYAGSDIGVFKSTDGGANWIPFSNGLPRVAVFGIGIQPTSRVLRIATHGRGMWDYPLPESAIINGTVTYGNAIGSPNPRFVSNVLLSGAGSPAVSTTTGALGTYSLTGFGAGSYTITPSKTGSVNGTISSFDAARIAQHAAGGNPLTGNQLVVADVSGNGTVSSFDAGQVARYAASISGSGSSGNWIFNPASNTHATVGTIAGEDYSALLMGEVSGNWMNGAGRTESGSGKFEDTSPQQSARRTSKTGIAVGLPQLTVSAGKEMNIPVRVQGAASKGIISYEFDLTYDSSVIQPQKDPVDLAGSVSRGLIVVANPSQPGLMRVVIYGPMPIGADGVLLNLRFAAVGKAGSASGLMFERMMFNEGDSKVTVSEGRIQLF
jgi:hypothetical protein